MGVAVHYTNLAGKLQQVIKYAQCPLLVASRLFITLGEYQYLKNLCEALLHLPTWRRRRAANDRRMVTVLAHEWQTMSALHQQPT